METFIQNQDIVPREEYCMKIELDCRKRIYEATAYGMKYKTYGDAEGTVVVHVNRREVKSRNLPDSFKITIEWEEEKSESTS